MTRPRVVVLRALGLGDFLTGLPALRGIRRALPRHELILAAPIGLAPLLALADRGERLVDDLVDTGGPETLPLSLTTPAIAVNLHGRGPQSHQELLGLHPGRLIAYARPDLGVPGPRWDDEEHEVRRWCRLVDSALSSAHCDPDDLDLSPPPQESMFAGAIVVHPGATAGARRWPAARFAAVARVLANAGYRVVITGSPSERVLARSVAEAAGLPPAAAVAGRTDLQSLAGIVAEATLVIAGDGGVAHLATAYRRRSITLCGPLAPALWGPPRRPQHLAVWHGDGDSRPGDPHGGAVDPRLAAITVEEVLAAARALLRTPVATTP